MFSQATDIIRRMEYRIKHLESRTSQTECDIHNIRNDNGLDKTDIQVKMATLKYDIVNEVGSDITSLKERLCILENAVSELQASMKEFLSVIRAEPSVKSENPKQKIDLEIFEQNDENTLDYFITPEYYFQESIINDFN